ncbi:MAG: outer membrane beta-barrel protein [Bacteroidota bacterium]
MKKLIFALLAVGSVAAANAQSNSILLYGNAGLSTYTDSASTNHFNWNLSPGIGYQFDQHWTIGLALSYGQMTTKVDGGDRVNNNVYSAGAFGRYTHNISNIFYCYGQLDMGYHGGNTTGNAPTSNRFGGFYSSLTPAVGINIKNGYALNFSIGGVGYMTTKYDDLANGSSGFNITFGQQMNVGISKNFACHHMRSHHEPGEDAHKMKEGDDDDAPSKKATKKARKDDDD